MKRKAKRASDYTFYIMYKECLFCRWRRLKDYKDGEELDFETTNPQRFFDLLTKPEVVNDMQDRFRFFDEYNKNNNRST